MLKLLLAAAMVCSFPLISAAQEAESADSFLAKQQEGTSDAGTNGESGNTAPAQPLVETDAETIAKKVETAKKMHQLRPTKVQVDTALEKAAQGLPEADRAPFLTAMKGVINYNAIEKISVDAMVETFTLQELNAMYAYYSTPEAKSIGEKMPIWGQKVQPEIVRMIDSALMHIKTGAPTAIAPGQPGQTSPAQPAKTE